VLPEGHSLLVIGGLESSGSVSDSVAQLAAVNDARSTAGN
jgi:hypothetical protein